MPSKKTHSRTALAVPPPSPALAALILLLPALSFLFPADVPLFQQAAALYAALAAISEGLRPSQAHCQLKTWKSKVEKQFIPCEKSEAEQTNTKQKKRSIKSFFSPPSTSCGALGTKDPMERIGSLRSGLVHAA